MPDFIPSHDEEVSLTLVEEGITIRQWTSYEYHSDIENPADGWSFTVGARELPDPIRTAIVPGARVRLTVNGSVQGDGYIDSKEIHASRESGTQITIEGRDRIAQVVDACADPTLVFKEGATLLDVLIALFSPFGWSSPDQFIVDNAVNRDAKKGIRGTPMSKGGKRRGPKPLKSFVVHQLRPYNREGVFEFASRVCKRHGLMIWPSASGDQIIVGTPDFDQEPSFELRRDYAGTTNVLDGSVKFDVTNQPSVIIADGASGGGEFGRAKIKSRMLNTAFVTDDKSLVATCDRYPDARAVNGHAFPDPLLLPHSRPMFLHDNESRTQEQLDNFVRREMARLQRHSLQVHYTVQGHGQNTPNGFIPWTVDTTVEVQDTIAGLNERLYVHGRVLMKSRHGGTTTRLDLIRLHTIELGEPDESAPQPTIKTDGAIVRERTELSL